MIRVGCNHPWPGTAAWHAHLAGAVDGSAAYEKERSGRAAPSECRSDTSLLSATKVAINAIQLFAVENVASIQQVEVRSKGNSGFLELTTSRWCAPFLQLVLSIPAVGLAILS